MTEAAAEQKLLRMAPELRRSAIYAMVGLVLIGVLMSLVCVTGKDRREDAIHPYVVLAVLALPLIIPLRWALRVDERGVARRRVWGWDVWEWHDFENGNIHKLRDHTLADPRRPWWRRRLGLGWLSGADRKTVLDLINARYQLPPPPEVVSELEIKYGFRRSARFDERGLHLVVRGKEHDYVWGDVERLHIARLDPLRRDFWSLELTLPDRQIVLGFVTHQGGTSPRWSGAGAEELNEFLLAHVPPERVDIGVWGERPPTVADVERQLQQVRKQQREFRIMLWCCSVGALGLLVYAAIAQGVIPALVYAGFVAAYALLAWCVVKPLREKRQKLESWLAELQDAEAHPTDSRP